ncbi:MULTISPECIES: hypothetical protein [unclassified Streptomyces]|uniref:hypothetical protein n=1 Tax=unclassified Streptomyces TaxID=2593676 RepID=UPI000B884E4E|nr:MULTISPECIES: hypothetical protein [unclassified Streptomyces]MYS22522.1 hypothetical protein [Streptomyces sp. SID4948]
MPRGTYDRATAAPSPLVTAAADVCTTAITTTVAEVTGAPITVADAITHHRRRLAIPRTHRVNPCFSDDEWTEITAAASDCHLTPGGFTAAATVAYSRADRRTSIDEERRRLEGLMEANRALAATGSRLNQLARYLNSGGMPNPEPASSSLERITRAVKHVDAAVLAIPHPEPVPPSRSPSAGPPPAAEIAHQHRRRMNEPRRNRTHPCFSDGEWADLTTAAAACRLKPGGYAAATALLAARTTDPRAAIADTRRQLEELMESNRQLAAVGNNLNQVLARLRPGDSLHDQTHRTLELVRDALDGVDTAASEIVRR